MRKTHLVLVGLLLSITLNATNDIPRPEYPRPQFERAEWINLNGTWNYEFDFPIQGKPEVDNRKAVRQHNYCSFLSRE